MTATATKLQPIEPARCPCRERLLRMADAASEAVACIGELHASGSNLVLEALRHGGEFTEWEHYPIDDARDPMTHARYYLHAHSAEGRERPDYAHFHVFLDADGVPARLRRGEASGLDRPVHLVAISMTPDGMPERLFTTNRWVCDESWYPAGDVIAMLDRFAMTGDQPSQLLNRWLTAVIVLFGPQIEALLLERDRTVAAWQGRDPAADVLEDRRLEVTSSLDVSLAQQIGWLEMQLDG